MFSFWLWLYYWLWESYLSFRIFRWLHRLNALLLELPFNLYLKHSSSAFIVQQLLMFVQVESHTSVLQHSITYHQCLLMNQFEGHHPYQQSWPTPDLTQRPLPIPTFPLTPEPNQGLTLIPTPMPMSQALTPGPTTGPTLVPTSQTPTLTPNNHKAA